MKKIMKDLREFNCFYKEIFMNKTFKLMVASLSIALVCGGLVGCNSNANNYEKAKKYYDEQNYSEAYKIFSQLGDYENSSNYINDINEILDNNTKQIYMSISVYLSDMETQGKKIENEVIKLELSNEMEYHDLKYNGDISEIQKIVQQYSIFDTGYVLLLIEENCISKVLYCKEDCFGEDYANFDISNISIDEYYISQYPSYTEYTSSSEELSEKTSENDSDAITIKTLQTSPDSNFPDSNQSSLEQTEITSENTKATEVPPNYKESKLANFSIDGQNFNLYTSNVEDIFDKVNLTGATVRKSITENNDYYFLGLGFKKNLDGINASYLYLSYCIDGEFRDEFKRSKLETYELYGVRADALNDPTVDEELVVFTDGIKLYMTKDEVEQILGKGTRGDVGYNDYPTYYYYSDGVRLAIVYTHYNDDKDKPLRARQITIVKNN